MRKGGSCIRDSNRTIRKYSCGRHGPECRSARAGMDGDSVGAHAPGHAVYEACAVRAAVEVRGRVEVGPAGERIPGPDRPPLGQLATGADVDPEAAVCLRLLVVACEACEQVERDT